MAIYVKIFLLTSILFTAGKFLFAIIFGMSFDIALGNLFVSSLKSGLTFGILMSLVIGTINKISTRRHSDVSKTTPIQSVTLIVLSPLDEAIARCQAAILGIGASIDKVDAHSGQVEASTKVSWKSFGEKISFRLSDRGDQTTEVEIESRPKLTMTIVDYGKSRENIDQIVAMLM
ncbi:MAG: hypothetical protein ACR2RA_22465 [Geminicoccaceae bacterium]